MFHPWSDKPGLFHMIVVATLLLWLLNPLFVLDTRDMKKSLHQTFPCVHNKIPPQDFCPNDLWIKRTWSSSFFLGAELQSTQRVCCSWEGLTSAAEIACGVFKLLVLLFKRIFWRHVSASKFLSTEEKQVLDSFEDAAEKYRSFCSRSRWWRVREHGRKESPREDVCISSALSVRSQSKSVCVGS